MSLSKDKQHLLIFFVFFTLLFSVFTLAQEDEPAVNKNGSFDIVFMLDKSGSFAAANRHSRFASSTAEHLITFLEMYQKISKRDIKLAFIPFGEFVLNSPSKLMQI